MGNSEKAVELKVGIFVIVGLLVIAVMVLKFGRLGQTFGKSYEITVELPDASGLIKDAEVKLAGTKIGVVAQKPQIAPSVSGVRILLKISEGIVIPKAMEFQVGSSGLLGDKFVEILPGPKFNSAKFNPADPAEILHAGDVVKGAPPGGLDALTRKGQVVMDQLSQEIEDLRVTTAKINDGILSDANQKNLSDTLLNLKNTSASFVETSKNINTVVQSAQGVMDGAKQTITAANTTMVTVNSAAGDLRVTLDEARKTMAAAKTLLLKATQGDGLVATLLNNRELSENVKALIVNLRQRGVLFYKDISASQKNQKPAEPERSR
jgi:ABC-type transporter Mla subunit MlaD